MPACSFCGNWAFRVPEVCIDCRGNVLAPIYVASLGRPEAPLFSILEQEGIPYTIVVEPHEDKLYSRPNKLVLPQSQRGLPYARQFILEYARRHHDGWIWIIDDDMNSFATVVNGRCVRSTATRVLTEAQTQASAIPRCAQVGLAYRQFAWTAKHDYIEGTSCDAVVMFHVQRTRGVDYRADLRLKGDREYTLRLMLAGWRVVRLNKLASGSPASGCNAGGLAKIYATAGEEKRAAEKVAALHPEVCTVIVKADGRPDVKFDWRKARALALGNL